MKCKVFFIRVLPVSWQSEFLRVILSATNITPLSIAVAAIITITTTRKGCILSYCQPGL